LAEKEKAIKSAAKATWARKYVLLYSSRERCEQHGKGLQSMSWTPLHFQSRTSSFEFLRCAYSPPQGIHRGKEEAHRRNSLEELPGWKCDVQIVCV